MTRETIKNRIRYSGISETELQAIEHEIRMFKMFKQKTKSKS